MATNNSGQMRCTKLQKQETLLESGGIFFRNIFSEVVYARMS
jgi:hypothetical protein